MRKYSMYLLFITVVIASILFYVFNQSYFLNESPFLAEFKKSDFDNKNIELELLAQDKNYKYFDAKINITNMDLLTNTLKKATNNKNGFYIDSFLQYIYLVDNNKQITKLINWNRANGQISNLTSDENKNIYVQWTKFDKYDSRVVKEGISKYDERGKLSKIVFEKQYVLEQEKNTPLGTGLIKNMVYKNKKLYFVYQKNDFLEVYSYGSSLVSDFKIELADLPFKIIDIVGTSLGDIYFSTNNSKIMKIDSYKNIIQIKNFLEENRVIDKLSLDGDLVKVELLSDNGVQVEEFSKADYLFKTVTYENVKTQALDYLKYSKGILYKKYLIYALLLISILLIVHMVSFIHLYIFQGKIYIVVKQLIWLIPIILIGMFVFMLNTVVLGFSEFSDEIRNGKYYQFSEVIDSQLKNIENKTGNPYYLGDLLNSFELNKDISPVLYNDFYNLVNIKGSNVDIKTDGMYVVIDKVINNKVYKMLDSESNFKLYYPRFAKVENPFFKSASMGKIVNAVGTNEKYIFTMKPIYDSYGKVAGIYQVGMYYKGYRNNVDMEIYKSIILGIIITTIVIVLSVALVTYFSLRPLISFTRSVKEITMGKLETEIEVNSKDEVEDLSNAFNALTKGIRKYISSITMMGNSYYRFVPQEIFEILGKKSVDEIGLGENKKFNLCILNACIEDLYAIPEKITEEESFALLNEYFRIIGPIIRKHNGVIEKYLEKGVLAIFPNGSQDAIKAASSIVKKVNSYNQIKNLKLSTSEIKIAIHKGSALVGIVGEEKRLQSSIVSESAELAAIIRLNAKKLWSNILVSEEIMRDIEPLKYDTRRLGSITFANEGKTLELYDVYESDIESIKNIKNETREMFENAITNFREGKFYDARSSFAQILGKNIEDNAARIYFYESNENYKNGVEKDWNESLKI